MVRRVIVFRGLLLVLVVFGLWAGGVSGEVGDASRVKVIQAVRAEVVPVLDGKLDDSCWDQAPAVSGFLNINSEQLASFQTFGQVCYDGANLYIGMKCLMPVGMKPKGFKRVDDGHLFSDDSVEIMIDPGRSISRYFQVAANAYGSTYDSVRQFGGAQNDSSWEGNWQAATCIGDGFWSIEVAVPFYSLGITADTGSRWGLNLCRNVRVPHNAYTSLGVHGAYNNAPDFPLVTNIDVDFSRYLYQIGPCRKRFRRTPGGSNVMYSVPVANRSGSSRNVTIECVKKDGKVDSKTVVLAENESVIFTESLDAMPLVPARRDAFAITSESNASRVVVSDATTGVKLATSNLARPWYCEAMGITVRDPWDRDTPMCKTESVSLRVHTNVTKENRESGTLRVALRSRATGEICDTRSLAQPGEVSEIVFEVKDNPWGAYHVNAELQDVEGSVIVSSQTVATVLPGGKHYIKVLNNFVSELMNARERGLLNQKEIAFMNPRDGWVFFAIRGECQVRLDGEAECLALGETWDHPGEAMRYLAAGRHSLQFEGVPKQVIVRSVPQLIYSSDFYRYTPDIMRDALTNANTILAGSNDKTAFMRDWVASGKRFLAFAAAPSHRMVNGQRVEDSLVSAQDCYKQIASHVGFSHPLQSGVMVDQIGSATPRQKMAIATALGRVADNSEFDGRVYCPWYESGIGGSGPDRAIGKVLSDAGWPFSFYRYIAEQPTEDDAAKQIQDQVVNTLLASEENASGAIRSAVVTLGYLSYAVSGESQNVNPGVDFKVLMQMQMETLAKHPKLFGIFGVLWYYSPYVEEENFRWGGRLFRH